MCLRTRLTLALVSRTTQNNQRHLLTLYPLVFYLLRVLVGILRR